MCIFTKYSCVFRQESTNLLKPHSNGLKSENKVFRVPQKTVFRLLRVELGVGVDVMVYNQPLLTGLVPQHGIMHRKQLKSY